MLNEKFWIYLKILHNFTCRPFESEPLRRRGSGLNITNSTVDPAPDTGTDTAAPGTGTETILGENMDLENSNFNETGETNFSVGNSSVGMKSVQ